MPENMMRMAGRGDDGTAKAIHTNNSGDIITRQSGKMMKDEVFVNITVEPGVWYYSDSIDCSDTDSIYVTPASTTGAGNFDIWAEFSNDGNVMRGQTVIYEGTTNNGGIVPIGYNPKIQIPMKFVRFRVRNNLASSKNILIYVRKG